MVKFVRKSLKFVNKYLFYIALAIFLVIAISSLIFLYFYGEIIIGILDDFNLNLKDFITAWIALGGIFGAVIGIYKIHKCVVLKEIQLESVCKVLCAHVCAITNKSEYREKYKEKPANEIQTIIDLLFKKDKDGDGKTIFNGCEKNLEGAFLSGVDFSHAVLDNIYFSKATLTHVNFRKAKLNDVRFNSAMLTKVDFRAANLKKVYFNNANIRSINFFDTKLKNVCFKGTFLEGHSYEKITKEDLSLDWQ